MLVAYSYYNSGSNRWQFVLFYLVITDVLVTHILQAQEQTAKIINLK